MKMIWKLSIPSIALAALAGAFLSAAAPAEARSMCHKRYQACESRCARANADFFPCINRTCNPQYDNCEGIGRGKRAGLVAPNRPNMSPRPANTGLPTGGVKPKQDGGIGTGSARPNGGGFRPFASGRR